MERINRSKIVDLTRSTEYGKRVNVKGWVRTKRTSKNVAFINLNDGSTIHNIQAVVDLNIINEENVQHINTGAAVSIIGKLIESPGSGQNVEINAEEVINNWKLDLL